MIKQVYQIKQLSKSKNSKDNLLHNTKKNYLDLEVIEKLLNLTKASLQKKKYLKIKKEDIQKKIQ